MNDMNKRCIGRKADQGFRSFKYTTSGTVMGFFSLAVNRSVKKNEKVG